MIGIDIGMVGPCNNHSCVHIEIQSYGGVDSDIDLGTCTGTSPDAGEGIVSDILIIRNEYKKGLCMISKICVI